MLVKESFPILLLLICFFGAAKSECTSCKWKNRQCKAGEPGLKGDHGDKGATGIQGVKGDTGLDGLKGKDGINGIPGEPGIQGQKGESGANTIDIRPELLRLITEDVEFANKLLELTKGEKGAPGEKGKPTECLCDLDIVNPEFTVRSRRSAIDLRNQRKKN